MIINIIINTILLIRIRPKRKSCDVPSVPQHRSKVAPSQQLPSWCSASSIAYYIILYHITYYIVSHYIMCYCIMTYHIILYDVILRLTGALPVVRPRRVQGQAAGREGAAPVARQRAQEVLVTIIYIYIYIT